MVDRTKNVSGFAGTAYAPRGILTTAHGPDRFVDMAKNLAMSLEIHSPGLPRAVVTDSDDPELKKLFQVIVPYRPDFGPGFFQNSVLDLYSPFQETLYIGSDCLCVRDINELWGAFHSVPFGISGRHTDERHLSIDIPALLAMLELDYLPLFNGGLLYFQRSPEADSVFAQCRDIMDHYSDLPLDVVPAGASDEVAYALALALHGVREIDDHCVSMATTEGSRGRVEVDVLGGKSRFEKDGQIVNPAIVHFAGNWTKGMHYRRERMKLDLVVRRHWPRMLASITVNAVTAPFFAAQIRRETVTPTAQAPAHSATE